MKKVFLLHGMSSRLDECFGLKLKQDLKNLGYVIYEPRFPLAPDITLANWTAEMDKLKAKISNDTIFVCHSLGTNFVIKYLAKNKLKAKALIAVAGGLLTEGSSVQPGFEYLEELVPTLQEMDYAANYIDNRYNIINRNDNIWKPAELSNYTSKLKAKSVELSYGGHFGRSSGVKEIPEIIEIIKVLDE